MLPTTANRNAGATAPMENPLAACAHGEPVDEQRARVVQQALAFEDGEEAMRWSQLPQHGGCGRGVRWCHDGAERDRRGPRHGGDQRAHHHRDGDGGEAYRNNDQTGDRCPVVAEIPGRRVIRSIEQDGRHEQRQGELRQHGERRRPWHEREEGATDREKRRIGCADTARRRGQEGGGEDQNDEDFELSHLTPVLARGPRPDTRSSRRRPCARSGCP